MKYKLCTETRTDSSQLHPIGIVHVVINDLSAVSGGHSTGAAGRWVDLCP